MARKKALVADKDNLEFYSTEALAEETYIKRFTHDHFFCQV